MAVSFGFTTIRETASVCWLRGDQLETMVGGGAR